MYTMQKQCSIAEDTCLIKLSIYFVYVRMEGYHPLVETSSANGTVDFVRHQSSKSCLKWKSLLKFVSIFQLSATFAQSRLAVCWADARCVKDNVMLWPTVPYLTILPMNSWGLVGRVSAQIANCPKCSLTHASVLCAILQLLTCNHAATAVKLSIVFVQLFWAKIQVLCGVTRVCFPKVSDLSCTV